MERIRVRHLARTINRYDFIDTIVRYLDKERFETGMITFHRESNIESPRYEEVGIAHRVIPVSSYRAYGRYVAIAWPLARMLRQERVQLLHAHHYWEGVVAALAKKLYPSVHLILHRHYTEDVLRLPPLKRRFMLGIERWMYRQSDLIIVPTHSMGKIVKYLHQNMTNIEIIPYGFEFSAEKYQRPSEAQRRAVRVQYGASEEHFVIINVATHRHQKGQHILLQAFQKFWLVYPQARLWLVGEGPETPVLKVLAEKLGLLAGGVEAPCRFLGWRRGLEVRDLMAAADLFVHPTFSEAFPQVMVESLSLGVPLVITPVSGAADYLTHGETAWFIPVENVEALTEALCYLYQHPERRALMVEKGRSLVREKFDYALINKAYEQLYASLV